MSLPVAMTADPVVLTSATQGIPAALRAACQLLKAAPGEISAVSVAGRLRPGSTALPLLARAESLARDFECSVRMRLRGGSYEIRFWRTGDARE